jgi:hypothetical protein
MLDTLYSLLGFSRRIDHSQKLETQGASAVSVALVVSVGFFGFFGNHSHGMLVAVMTGTILWEFMKRVDQGVPLMHVAALLSVLQWLIGPWLTYNIDIDYSTYFMRVDSIEYFSYALPATAAFIVGLLLAGGSVRQKSLLADVDNSKFVEVGILLVFLGFLGGFLIGLLPKNVGFILLVVSQLRYVAAIYFILSTGRFKWLLAVLAIMPLFTSSAESGMFHDLLIWTGIIFCYGYAAEKRRVWLTVLLIIVFSFSVFTIQGIKQSYRDKVWNGMDGSLVDEVKAFWVNPELAFSDEILSNGIMRLNQGWIVAAIMSNVPELEPYAKGDTLSDALIAALVPRVLYEGKASAGGQVNYRRFTGLPLSDNTSMGMGLIGEAYANVGPRGGLILMFLFGLGLAISYRLFSIISLRYVTFYFWIPLIFAQVVKAETDLVTILNHVVKGSVLTVAMYWLVCVKFLRVTPALDFSSRDKNRLTRRGTLAPAAVTFGRNINTKL